MAIPFEASNLLALDGSVPSSVTESVDGVTQWSDSGTSGNDFVNNHASGSQPGYANPTLTFFDDHLHRDPVGGLGLIPATGDWTLVARFSVSATNDEALFTQYIPQAGNGRLNFRVISGQLSLFLGNSADGSPSVQVSGGTISTGTLYTATAVRSGSTFNVRLGGTQVATRTDSGTRQILQTGNLTGGFPTSGANYDAPNSFLNGSIIRIGLWSGNPDVQALEDWAKTSGVGVPLPLLQGMI